MLQVKQDGFFPADLLFLASTNADGVCYIEVPISLLYQTLLLSSFFSLFQKINWPVDVLFGSVLAFSCINFSFFIADRKFGWGNKFEDQKGIRKDMGLLDS